MKYTKGVLQVVNKTEGEILDVNDLTNDIVNCNLEEIAQRLVIAKEVSVSAQTAYRVLESKFLLELEKINAKKYVSDDINISLTPQFDYEYRIEKINQLKSLITEEEFNIIFSIKYKVNRTELKSLNLRGGEIQKVIKQLDVKLNKKPTVNITKK